MENNYSTFSINKNYILFIFLIVVLLVFSKNNEKNYDDKYEKMVMENINREKNMEKLLKNLEEKQQELEELQLKILELKVVMEDDDKKIEKIKLFDENIEIASEKKKNLKINEKKEKIFKLDGENNHNHPSGRKIDLSKIKSYYLTWPTDSKEVEKRFGEKLSFLEEKEEFSRGIEIKMNRGDIVISGITGVVTHIEEEGKYGNMIELQRDDGLKVRYGNLKEIKVEYAQDINVGDYIGEVLENEENGYKLYYEVIIEEIPVDPMKFKYREFNRYDI